MASDKTFITYITDQLQGIGEVLAKPMFGEYGLYLDGKLFALVCDNCLFIKPTVGGREFIGEVTEGAPYPGAKPSLLIEDQMEDRDWLGKLVQITVLELPEPKVKKKK